MVGTRGRRARAPGSNTSIGLRAIAALVLAVALAVLAGCGSSAVDRPTPASTPPGVGQVVRVVDGDTLVVRLGERDEKVRLIGIDTPETKSPTKPVQCYGKEASAHLAQLLAAGAAVRLEGDVTERDVYGRLLAYVYRLSDGLFVNLDLAVGGYADSLRIAPNVAHAAELQTAVDQAHQRGAGLWGACGGPGRPAS